MALLDLLGRRWALRVMWELRDGHRLSFGELRDACGGMSTSVLSTRLGELGGAGIVVGAEGGYRLTGEGIELITALAPLEAWARRWGARAST